MSKFIQYKHALETYGAVTADLLSHIASQLAKNLPWYLYLTLNLALTNSFELEWYF